MTKYHPPQVLDLFAGAGGFSLGFYLAGFKIIGSLEIDAWAVETLKFNHPGVKILHADIRNFDHSEILSSFSDKPQVIIGGPPCQGFSIAGPAQKDPSDPRNSLFIDFARWVQYLEPQVFVMENVKGLINRRTSQGHKVIDIIQNTFCQLGYTTEVWILNAALYGVPQIRERVFVIGNRMNAVIGKPQETHSLYPSQHHNGVSAQTCLFSSIEQPSRAIHLWEAISDLPVLEAGQGTEEQAYDTTPQSAFQQWARGSQCVLFNHVAMKHTSRLVERFRQIGWGESSSDVLEDYRAHKRNGNGEISQSLYDQNNRRLYPDKPSHTIAASFYANFIHPYQHRNLTAREGARIQSFPDSYRFLGKKTVVSQKLLAREGRHLERHLCQYNQIGNAVPPLLAQAIASHIKEIID